MSSFVVCDGDEVVFEANFGERQVMLSVPAVLTGTGLATVSKRPMCVVGDEKRFQWPAQYFIAGYTPGTGTVSIEMLDGSQSAPYVSGRAPLILKGTQFTARFTPTVVAVMSQPPYTADPAAPSFGRGSFNVHQGFVHA